MNDNTQEELIHLHSLDSPDRAWNEFSSMNTVEQKKLFLALLNQLISPRVTNKAVIMPNAASVINRQLKPGVDFNTWYQGWLPPMKPHKVGNDIIWDYFPFPTRVINLRSIKDDTQFLTLGFMHNPFSSVDELLNARPKEVKEDELERRNINDELLTKSENEFYSVTSDDIFG